MYYIFFIGMILLDSVVTFTFYKAYRKTKSPMLGILTLWFTSRFFAGLLSFIWNSCFHWNPIHVQNVSTIFEAFLMVKFCMLFITKKSKILNLLWVIIPILYGIELYIHHFQNNAYNYSASFYFIITCILLIRVMAKEKISNDHLIYVHILFVYHLTSLIYIGNLDVLLVNVDLFKMVYPVVWIIYIAVDILSLVALRKGSTQLFKIDLKN